MTRPVIQEADSHARDACIQPYTAEPWRALTVLHTHLHVSSSPSSSFRASNSPTTAQHTATLLPSPPTQPLSNAATTTTTDSHPSNIHRFLPTTRLYLLHFSRFDDIALALSTVPPAVNNTESLSMNSWVRRQERTVRGKGAERQTKGEDEGKRSEKRWRGGERTTKRSAGYADSTCVRESTATFPHILSPCRQRARVQSAPIYRGGKAAAAYLVEYLPLSTRGRCTYRVVTLRCQHTEKACTRACALECALVVS